MLVYQRVPYVQKNSSKVSKCCRYRVQAPYPSVVQPREYFRISITLVGKELAKACLSYRCSCVIVWPISFKRFLVLWLRATLVSPPILFYMVITKIDDHKSRKAMSKSLVQKVPIQLLLGIAPFTYTQKETAGWTIHSLTAFKPHGYLHILNSGEMWSGWQGSLWARPDPKAWDSVSPKWWNGQKRRVASGGRSMVVPNTWIPKKRKMWSFFVAKKSGEVLPCMGIHLRQCTTPW